DLTILHRPEAELPGSIGDEHTMGTRQELAQRCTTSVQRDPEHSHRLCGDRPEVAITTCVAPARRVDMLGTCIECVLGRLFGRRGEGVGDASLDSADTS